MKKRLKENPELVLFFILIILAAFGNGLSDSVYGNYFKEAYDVTAVQRGFIEFPRELPGLLCAVIIAALSGLGDIKSALIAQVCAFAGLAVLGFWTPKFEIMLIFLFINSLGMHLFMPLQDAIGMDLAEPDKIGKRMGQYGSVKSAVGFAAGILVFIGFRVGFFDFKAPIKLNFVIGAAMFLAAIVVSFILVKKTKLKKAPKAKFKLIFRKEYKFYYLLTVLHGVQKQIAFVYGSWVIIDLLAKGADIMALLGIVSSFILIFFMPSLGKWMDKFGIKKMMYLDALTFIIVYVLYGFVVWGITASVLPSEGWSVLIVYVLFVLDRLSMQVGIVKSIYLRSIALSDDDVTATLSTGTSLDHVVSIIAAAAGGFVWTYWGSQWVFFMAAAFSIGNLVIARLVRPEEEREHALCVRRQRAEALSASAKAKD